MKVSKNIDNGQEIRLKILQLFPLLLNSYYHNLHGELLNKVSLNLIVNI